jgi:hypothetical protein
MSRLKGMKIRNANGHARATEREASKSSATPTKRHSRWRTVAVVVFMLACVLGLGRALLPSAIRDYVNRTLDRNPLYLGKIGEVRVHLWRGAYSVEEVRISKAAGQVPVPLFAAKRVDFALQWKSLVHGKVVGRVLMEQPELNFVDAASEDEAQTGAGAPWLLMIRDLFPFKINSAIIKDGSVHFRAFQTAKPVDVYLSKVEVTIDNLSNIRDETAPLVSTVQATALVMDQAKLECKMTLDPFSYRPTFHLTTRLLGLDVTKLNDLALAYGKFDFKRGWFDLVLETDSKEGQYTGYVKPLFRNLQVFSLAEDIKNDNVIQFFWQALVGAVSSVLTNPSRDQFGTLIPFTGDVSTTTSADILATIGNLLRNAFVRAYLPRLQSGQDVVEGLQFGAPDFSESLSTQDNQ